MSKKPKDHKEPDSTQKEEKKKPIDISFPILPSDDETLDDEMRDAFEEDSVKHRHGETEPERD